MVCGNSVAGVPGRLPRQARRRLTRAPLFPVSYAWIPNIIMWATGALLVAFVYRLEASLVGIVAKSCSFLLLLAWPFLVGVLSRNDLKQGVAFAREILRSRETPSPPPDQDAP